MGVGGAQVRFAQLVGALPQPYRHLVVSMDGNFDALSRLPSTAPVEKVQFQYAKGETLRNWWLFRSLLTRHRPDLLITYNWGAIEWGLINLVLPKCPHIAILDGFGPEEARASIPRRVRLRRLVYGCSKAVIVPSRTLESLAVKGWGLAPDLVRYIPNGVNIDRFAVPADTARLRELGITTGERLVGTLASLRPEKNLIRLIDAFHAATSPFTSTTNGAIRLVIVGDGAERAALTDHVSRLGIAERVVFTGNIDRPEHILGALSVYAISSDTEQMPISLIEAMAAGLPVASVDVGDIGDMVSDDNRRFVSGTDALALAGSLRLLLAEPEQAAAIGRANQARAQERFSEATMVAAYDGLFREATGAHTRPSPVV